MRLELDGGKHVAKLRRNYEMGFILKDTEPSPAQDSSGVRQQGDLLGPPCAASLSVSLFTTRVSYKHNCNDGLIVESAHHALANAGGREIVGKKEGEYLVLGSCVSR